MDIRKQLGTDSAKESDGVWFDLGEGAAIKIARRNNRRYREKLRQLTKGKERQMQLRTLPEDVAEDIMAEAMAHGIIRDWRGLDDGGKTVRYSIEKAKEWLLDPELPDFRELVGGLSDDVEAFRKEQDEEAEKNSAKSSGSTSESGAKN